MYLTREQNRAVWFLIGVVALAVGWHYLKPLLFPPKGYDFSQFEQEFFRKRDSILQAVSEQSEKQEPVSRFSRRESLPSGKKEGEKTVRFPININTAGEEELQQLPRIGPALARRIVAYRQQHGPFRRKQDLIKVKGIGPKSFQQLKELITVEPTGVKKTQ